MNPKINVPIILLVASVIFSSVSANHFDPIDALLANLPAILADYSRKTNYDECDNFKGNWPSEDELDQELAPEDLIDDTGFLFQHSRVISKDGFITYLIRIINPYSSRSKLRPTPVVLLHDLSMDPAAYLWASTNEHFPENNEFNSYQSPSNRSSSRSLGFALANLGYDVWLVPTRGCNSLNQEHLQYSLHLSNEEASINRFDDGIRDEYESLGRYWNFTLDDLIHYELPSVLDRVLLVTGSKSLDLVAHSISATTSLALLSSRPDYGAKIRKYVCISPLLDGILGPTIVEESKPGTCLRMSMDKGTIILNKVLLSDPIKNELSRFATSPKLSVGKLKPILDIIFGSSPKCQTIIEQNVMAHTLRSFSFAALQQLCQSFRHHQFRKYDFGAQRNRLLYNSSEPPAYNLTKLHIRDWLLISGTADLDQVQKSVAQMMAFVEPKPSNYLEVVDYNRLDMLAGQDNDIKVNKPIIGYLGK